jgi:type I restriction enzyme S subunit
MTPYLRAANVKDGVLDLSDIKQMNFAPSEQNIFSLLPGDVLVTEGSGSLGSVGASAVWSGEIEGRVCFQNTLLRLRPRPGRDARFLAWWCRHAFADGIFASIATGANIFHVSAERVRALPMRDVTIMAQRAIADYLDLETARIDALITKKRRLVALLQERVQLFRQHVVLRGIDPTSESGVPPPGWGLPRLGPVVRLQRGHDLPDESRIHGNVPIVSSGGVSGWHHEVAARAPGVVTGRYGTIGSVFWVEEDYWPLNTTLYVRDFGGNVPRWVFYLLSALPLDIDAAKSAVTGINRNVIGQLRVPLPPVEEQSRIALAVDEVTDAASVPARLLHRQIDLLIERRQALITAAVTGELHVPGAA